MSFLPSRTVFEEKLVDNYNIINGSTAYTSSNIFDMSIISIQVIGSGISPNNDIELNLEQSNDGLHFDPIPNSTVIIDSNESITIERSNFSGKYIRINFIHAPDSHIGIINAFLIAKR